MDPTAYQMATKKPNFAGKKTSLWGGVDRERKANIPFGAGGIFYFLFNRSVFQTFPPSENHLTRAAPNIRSVNDRLRPISESKTYRRRPITHAPRLVWGSWVYPFPPAQPISGFKRRPHCRLTISTAASFCTKRARLRSLG